MRMQEKTEGDDLAALYPNAEVEVHAGGQPIYYYVISVE